MKFLTRRQAADLVGFHVVHLDRLEKAGRFPRKIQIGDARVGFLESEVMAWMRRKVDERDARLAERDPAEPRVA